MKFFLKHPSLYLLVIAVIYLAVAGTILVLITPQINHLVEVTQPGWHELCHRCALEKLLDKR